MITQSWSVDPGLVRADVRCRSERVAGSRRWELAGAPVRIKGLVAVVVSVRVSSDPLLGLPASLFAQGGTCADGGERLRAPLESERPARDRGFESPRFRPLTSEDSFLASHPGRPGAMRGLSLGLSRSARAAHHGGPLWSATEPTCPIV